MTRFFFKLTILFFCSIGPINAQEIHSSSYKKISVVWVEHSAFIVNHREQSVRTLYQDMDRSYYITETGEYSIEEVEKMTQEGVKVSYWESQSKYQTQVDFKMLSVVGPFISYQEDYYSEGGAHPSYGTGFETHHMKTDSSIRLHDIFNESDILNALQKNEFIQSHLTEEKYYRSIQSLFEHLDGDCNHYFSIENLRHFAFHHIKDNEVAVRIGISYGCEVMRGNFSQVELYLPIPRSLKKIFKQAKEKGLLMAELHK